MGRFEPQWLKIHDENAFSPWTPPLAVLSALYGLGVRLRLRAYRWGILKKGVLPGFVLSVGNITAGGTGKTPAVIAIAEWAKKEGHRVAILSRGYGSGHREEVVEVSNGEKILVDSKTSGDEPYLMAKRLTGIPVFISKSRFLAGLAAHQRHRANFFILDDGFQHIGLSRDLNIALINTINPFGNGHLLPWGPLREPLPELSRADVVVLTHSKSGCGKVEQRVREISDLSATPIFRAEHRPDKVVFPVAGYTYEADFLNGKRILAFAGIARPDQFENMLIRLGAELVYFKGFRDHHPFSDHDLRVIHELKTKKKAEFVVTTEKDWVRILTKSRVIEDLAYLSIRFIFLSSPDNIFEMIQNAFRKKTKVR